MGRNKIEPIYKVVQVPVSVPRHLLESVDRKELVRHLKEYTITYIKNLN